MKQVLLWPGLPCGLCIIGSWFWAGFWGGPVSWLIGISLSIAGCIWFARRLAGRRGAVRWASTAGACIAAVGVSCVGLLAGVALFPWHVQRHLPDYEQIAHAAKRALQGSSAPKLFLEKPRWDLKRALAQRQASGRIEVTLFFRGSGRRLIVNGAPERHVEGEGSCLVEFAPEWFWHRPCTEAQP